jgi:hypothetical protein
MNLNENTLLLLQKIKRELEPIGYAVVMNPKTRSSRLTDAVILHIKWSKEVSHEDFVCNCYAMIEFQQDSMIAMKVLGDYPIVHWILSRHFKITRETRFASRISPIKIRKKSGTLRHYAIAN